MKGGGSNWPPSFRKNYPQKLSLIRVKHIPLSEFLLNNTFFLQSFNAFFSSFDKFDRVFFSTSVLKKVLLNQGYECFNHIWVTFWRSPQRLLLWKIVSCRKQCFIFVSVTTCICLKKWKFSKCIFNLIKINL